MGLIAMVLSGSYFVWEKMTILLCLLDTVWLFLMRLTPFTGHELLMGSFTLSMPPGGITAALVFLLIATVGTTIAPWQLFFQQSCVVDKGLTGKDLKNEQLDTFLSSIFTILVAIGMTTMGAVLYLKGIPFTDAAQMAKDLAPTIGVWGRNVILLMIMNASILGAMAVTLSSSWTYSEVMETHSGLGKKFTEAPAFYGLYILAVLAAAGFILIPQLPLQAIIIAVQVLAGLLLPPALIFLHILLNDKTVVGEEFLNKRWNNIANIIVIGLMVALSLSLIVIGLIS